MEANGSRTVTLSIELPLGTPPTVTLPLAHRGGRITRVAPGSVIGRVESGAGAAHLVLENVPGASRVEVDLDVPGEPPKAGGWGNRPFTHELVNTSPLAIASYKADLMLPEGYSVSTIDEIVPEASAKTPLDLVREGSRRGVSLTTGQLEVGSRVVVRLHYRSDRRSPLLAGILAVLAIAYLVRFRDLVRKTGSTGGREGG